VREVQDLVEVAVGDASAMSVAQWSQKSCAPVVL